MDKSRLSYLLTQHLKDLLSQAEERELQRLIAAAPQTVEVMLAELLSQHAESDLPSDQNPDYMQRMLERTLNIDRPRSSKGKHAFSARRLVNFRWVAAAALVLSISLGSYLYLKAPQPQQVAEKITPGPETAVDYVRTILLPDSSLVVLQARSTLTYPQEFGENSREVSLTGEAYFDIRKIANGSVRSPFVIYSGEIKTTVLGTSFNIKAYPDQPDITVSVVKGKVQIENKNQILAVLTKDQQISYQTEIHEQVATKVEATRVIEWIRADLEFKGESFEEIARILEKRYDVSIGFETDNIKNCITIASFEGTDTLDNILEILCTVRNASYRFETPTKIIINGDGC